jgi:hypothetical protein
MKNLEPFKTHASLISGLHILVQTPTPNIAITISTLQTPPLPNEQVSSTLL